MEEHKKVRVLHIVNNLGVGGIEKLVRDLVLHVSSDQFLLEVCCVREKKGEWLVPIEAHGIQVHFLGNYRREPRRFFAAYQRLLVKNRYQAVHVHLNHISGLFLWHPARSSVPVRIAHYHNDFHRQNRHFLKRMFFKLFRKLTDQYATVSLGISDICMDSVYGKNWRQIKDVRRVYNGVDLEKYMFHTRDRQAFRSFFGIDSDSMVIGHVGRFRPQKNHAFIVDLAIELCHRFEKVVFFLVGDGLLFNDIQESVKGQGLEDKFIFAGARTNVPELMSLMDIFVLPSLWEGFGLTVIEAQASGLPVLASDNLPVEIPLINNSKRIPLDDLAAWVAACELLLESKKGAKERQTAVPAELREFSLSSWINKIVSLYEK